MFVLVFLLIVLLVLFIANRIYIVKNIKIEKEKLKNIQQNLFGYVGEPSKEKKEELYKKYIEINNKLV